jgi:hypothetical protein
LIFFSDTITYPKFFPLRNLSREGLAQVFHIPVVFGWGGSVNGWQGKELLVLTFLQKSASIFA